MTKTNPFLNFNTSPEIIHLVLLMYIRFPLSLRNVEDLLHEHGIDVSRETVRYWWNRFGPIFLAAEIRLNRIRELATLKKSRNRLLENNRAENSHLPFKRSKRTMLRCEALNSP